MTRAPYIVLLVACLVLPACTAAPSSLKPAANSGLHPESPIAAATDPCAARMEDIRDALMLYDAMHKHLPAALEDLQPVAAMAHENSPPRLIFTCPVSQKPYQYVPAGLSIPGVARRLVLYDATAAHGGQRWGIVMAPAQPGRPLMMWVIPVNEKLFRAYRESGNADAPG